MSCVEVLAVSLHVHAKCCRILKSNEKYAIPGVRWGIGARLNPNQHTQVKRRSKPERVDLLENYHAKMDVNQHPVKLLAGEHQEPKVLSSNHHSSEVLSSTSSLIKSSTNLHQTSKSPYTLPTAMTINKTPCSLSMSLLISISEYWILKVLLSFTHHPRKHLHHHHSIPDGPLPVINGVIPRNPL